MKQIIVQLADKTASVIREVTLGEGEEVTLLENERAISSPKDLVENLTMPQLLSLHNARAREQGKQERNGEWKNKATGADAVFALLVTKQISINHNEKKAIEKAAAETAAGVTKPAKTAAAKKAVAKAEKGERKKKPDTKRAKLVAMFAANAGKHLDRNALMAASGFSEGALITNISKLRTDYHAKNHDISQGGVEITFGMNINKHKATQTWTYDPAGNADTNFQADRVKEAIQLVKKG